MLTIQVESPEGVAADRQREFADTVIGAAVDLLGVPRAEVKLVIDDMDDPEARRAAAFWAAAWSGC
jgi:phenylpyruvate tautomerase PptA (4-oxalocrotonate tautomerase family)